MSVSALRPSHDYEEYEWLSCEALPGGSAGWPCLILTMYSLLTVQSLDMWLSGVALPGAQYII